MFCIPGADKLQKKLNLFHLVLKKKKYSSKGRSKEIFSGFTRGLIRESFLGGIWGRGGGLRNSCWPGRGLGVTTFSFQIKKADTPKPLVYGTPKHKEPEGPCSASLGMEEMEVKTSHHFHLLPKSRCFEMINPASHQWGYSKTTVAMVGGKMYCQTLGREFVTKSL